MPLALTIFGVGSSNTPARFCYAVLRRVRGSGDYPPPNLPHTARPTFGSKFPLGPSGAELLVWDQILERQLQAR